MMADWTDVSFRTISYGQSVISFRLVMMDRETLAISVDPDLSVSVSAPREKTVEEIEARILKRARWILKQQAYFREFLPHAVGRRYISGETHYYLGRQYRLKVEGAQSEEVKLKGAYLHVTVQDPTNAERVKRLLDDWLLTRARVRFALALERCWERFGRFEKARPTLRIRRMHRRWGSCTSSGAILINPELVKAPSSCIEYVIAHELCHLRHPDHGKGFQSLLRRTMPDWEQRKARLERAALAFL